MFKGFTLNGQFYKRSTKGPGKTGVRVTTFTSPKGAAQFVAESLGRDQALVAHDTELGEVPIIRDGQVAPEALAYLSRLLSDEEISLLALFGVPIFSIRDVFRREDT
jgi:hypothetical protein